MKIVNHFNQKKYQFLFILFVTYYTLYYSFYGYNDADDGYTMALSWRIFNGEFPYLDFILVRPPLSPLFHSLQLFIIPDSCQIVFDRIFCYLLFASSSLLGALAIDRVLDLRDFKLNPYMLATIGFVYSVGSFPATAWHTIDGIFFASIGVYILICRTSILSIILGMIFLFLSSICKQSFYLIPFIGIIFITIIYKNWAKSIAAILTFIISISFFILILYSHNAFTNFIRFTSGSTKLMDLLSAGIINYLNINSLYLILPFALWLIIKKQTLIQSRLLNEKVVPYFFILLLLVYPLLKFIYLILFTKTNYDFFFRDQTATILFIITILFLLEKFSLEKKWLAIWLLISISWCASISWGYKTPIFFSTPLLLGFFLVSNELFGVKNIGNLAIYTLVLGSFTYFIAYQKPYCNPIRQLLTYKIEILFPKMKGIYVSKETYDKYSDFFSLVMKYGINFKTLPGMPLSNYLTNTNSPINIDWVFNAETNNANQNIIKELELKKVIIFLEKSPQLIRVSDSKDKFNSIVAHYIKHNWQKIDSTQYFEIYKPSDKHYVNDVNAD